MATFTGGLASGIDSGLIIEQLVSLRGQAITQVKERQAAYAAQISAFGVIADKLAALGRSAASLASDGVVRTRVSGATTAFSAATVGGASAGRYSIAVEQLATAARLRSNGLASADAAVRAGALEIAVRGESFQVTIEEGMTLADVARAISESGAPVQALVIDDGTRSYLSLTNRETGHPIGSDPDAALVITQTLTGATGEALFPVDPDVPTGPTVVRAGAQNARLVIDGLTVERTGNTIGDLIPGVTLTLNKQSAASAAEELVLVEDRTASRARLDAFVGAWNDLARSMRSLGTAADGTAGLLSGDSTLRALGAELEGVLTRVIGAGSVANLADLGLQLQRDGTLLVDDATFAAALAGNPGAIDRLFSAAETGVAASIEALVARYNAPSTGILATRKEGLQETVDRMTDDIERKTEALEIYRQTLIRRFTALEEIVSKFDSIARFLDQQEAAREQQNR